MIALLIMLAAQRPGGYESIPPAAAESVKKGVQIWHDCIVYGISQVDDPKESAEVIADGAMAGCLRAEQNLEDRLFDGMKGRDDVREVRGMAHDMMAGYRQQIRSMAIRLVLLKHGEERRARPSAPHRP